MNFTTSAAPFAEAQGNGKHRNGHGLFTTAEPHGDASKPVTHLRLFWEHRRLLARVAVYAALISTVGVYLIPSRYKATAQLMPPDGQQGLGMALASAFASKGGSALSGLASDLLGTKNSGELFVGVLKSRTVADGLIQKYSLQHVYRDRKIEDARDDLADHTDIAVDRKSGIVRISVTDHQPQRAQEMAQSYVAELDRLVALVSTSAARRERIFLEGRLGEVKPELDADAKRFSEFASKNTAIDIPAQSKAMVEAAATLQGQLIAAESELSGLRQIYTAENFRVRALTARVKELQAQLQKMGGDSSNMGENKNELYPPIRKLPLLGVTYADLFRQTKIEETVFELLTQQYEMAKVQEAKEIPSVKVLDAPVVPTKKSFPPRFLLGCLGTALAVAGAAGWLVMRRRWKERGPDDPARVLAEEVGATARRRLKGMRPVAAKAMRVFAGKGEQAEDGARTEEIA
ncbi:MAG TPA: Wzz/FepE/Etk N-terminal domain-containing protein [Candidatus Acidoferrales bacterium]|nr:Wzz/FepE/Etk N-terminal domain-containing protein [Candidatus Acidoferrales bacterium]